MLRLAMGELAIPTRGRLGLVDPALGSAMTAPMRQSSMLALASVRTFPSRAPRQPIWVASDAKASGHEPSDGYIFQFRLDRVHRRQVTVLAVELGKVAALHTQSFVPGRVGLLRPFTLPQGKISSNCQVLVAMVKIRRFRRMIGSRRIPAPAEDATRGFLPGSPLTRRQDGPDLFGSGRRPRRPIAHQSGISSVVPWTLIEPRFGSWNGGRLWSVQTASRLFQAKPATRGL